MNAEALMHRKRPLGTAPAPDAPREWEAVLGAMNRNVIDRSRTGVCSIVLRRVGLMGADVSLHVSPTFASEPIARAVCREFTGPVLKRLFRGDRGWSVVVPCGRFVAVFGHAQDGSPAIRRCLLVRVQGTPDEQALLVFAGVPQLVDLEQCIDLLQATLGRAAPREASNEVKP